MIQQNLIQVQDQVYRKENQIGQGGYAIIYQGENVKTKQKVAIRIADDMTEDEFNIHQKLMNQKKKFIIDIKGLVYQEEQGTIIIIMELGKEDFHSFMKKDEFKNSTNQDKNLLFYKMVSAVDELHQLQYFHRDLKTENFIIIENFNKNQPNIKLIDFGLCKHMHNNNRLTQNAGTILFMAPEVISSDQYDKTSDVWSLGCIYFEIMTTQTFLQGTTYQELIDYLQTTQQNQIDLKIEKITSMNQEEKNLLKKMLQKDPSQRLTLKEILQKLDNLTKRNFQLIQQGKPFNNFPQNPIQPQQFILQTPYKQQQLSAVRLQSQIKNVIDQKYQKQLNEEISQFKKEMDEQLQQQIHNKVKELEQQNQYEQSRLENKIKQEYDLKIQQCQKDQEKQKELLITCELEMQNRLNELQFQQKEELSKNLDMFQQKIKKDQETKLRLNIQQKETEIYAQIELEQKQILEQKCKEFQEIQLNDKNKQKQQLFESKKQNFMHLITFYIELLQKNQKIIIEKSTNLKTFKELNQIKVSQISSKINDLLQDFEYNLMKANQVKLQFFNINDSHQFNLLVELENEYQQKTTLITLNSFNNIQQIDQEIQTLNQSDQNIKQDQCDVENQDQLKKISDKKLNLEQKLNELKNQLNVLQQLTKFLMQGCQEYEMIQLIQRLNQEIESLNQQQFKLKLIQNQFDQIKDLYSQKLQDSFDGFFQQCQEIEKQQQFQKEIIDTINQEFIKKEQIELQQLNKQLNGVETQFNFFKNQVDYFRKEFQNIQFYQIDDCENKLNEIQNLIKKICFQRQQLCIKKQKQTFDQLKLKFDEVNIQCELVIKQAEQLREANKYKQQFNKMMKKLLDQKQSFELQMVAFNQKSQNLRVNQDLQQQLLQQLDILRNYFQNYVQKYLGFENLSNDTAKNYQLNEIKQYLIELEQFFYESDQQLKRLFQQAQSILHQIEMSQHLKNEKWSQFNDLCQKVHQFQQQSKYCRLPKDIASCEYLCQLQKLKDLLQKYEAHFDKCKQYYQENEKISQELKSKLQQNLGEFNQVKLQNLKYIDQIQESADMYFHILTNFLNSIFYVQNEQIKFVKDSNFYKQICDSVKNYQELQEKVDSLNSEISNYFQKENQYDNDFYGDKVKAINAYIVKLEHISLSLNQFDEVEFQKDRQCFIKLVIFLIVIQLQILNELIQRQLKYDNELQLKNQEQLEKNQSAHKFEQINNKDNQKQQIAKLQNKMDSCQLEQTKFKQFLNLNDLCFNLEYIELTEKKEVEIEQESLFIQGKDKSKLQTKFGKKDSLKKIEDYYYRTIEYNKMIIYMLLSKDAIFQR